MQFHDIEAIIRAEVNILQGQGVNKIIALGHAGFTVDQKVAEIDGVDVVVGGHTDTFLYTGNARIHFEIISAMYRACLITSFLTKHMFRNMCTTNNN